MKVDEKRDIKRKLSVTNYAKQIGNVKKACRYYGISRSIFYVSRSSWAMPSFFNDVKAYYPGLLHESYRSNGEYAHQQLVFLAQWGIRDGIFREDMDVEVVGKTVLFMLKLLKNKKTFPVAEFSIERLTFGILVPYLRGMCTPKGLELLEIQEELFRVSI